jgi:hypothetical protein
MSLGEKPNKMIGESLWRLLARRTEARLEREQMWDALEPYERPKSLTPLLLLNVAAFYTGVVAAAITEQLHKVRDSIKPAVMFFYSGRTLYSLSFSLSCEMHIANYWPLTN